MIISKPKKGTLFSLGLFIAICLAIASYTGYALIQSTTPPWYLYATTVVLFPLGLGLLARTIFGYKVVEVGKERIDVRFPARFKKESHRLKEIEKWREHVVKTVTGTYKELDIRFSDKKQLTLALQEHTEYPKVVKYLKKKCSRQEVRN